MNIPTDWTFKNADVARGFDSHVREQLPWYDLATGAAAHLARHYIPEKGVVYDIGASTGNIGIAIEETITSRCVEFVPIEVSEEMAKVYAGPGSVVIADAMTYEYQPFDVAFLFLVLMFIPVKNRSAFMNKLVDKCNVGGAIIIVDKVHPPGGWLGTVFRRLTLAGKVATGTLPGDIVNKELSLSGIQRPVEPHPLAKEFFRFGEFVGWIIEK